MSQHSTVFKVTLQITDMNRNYYNNHLFTIARHSSETDERMMVRLLAFALHANDNLTFANGLTESTEADIWQKDFTDNILLWIDVGLPDEKLIRKACARSEQVIVYTYGGRTAEVWWDKNKSKLLSLANLKIINIVGNQSQEMALLAQRGMKLTYTILDNEITLSDDKNTVSLTLDFLKMF